MCTCAAHDQLRFARPLNVLHFSSLVGPDGEVDSCIPLWVPHRVTEHSSSLKLTVLEECLQQVMLLHIKLLL